MFLVLAGPCYVRGTLRGVCHTFVSKQGPAGAMVLHT